MRRHISGWFRLQQLLASRGTAGGARASSGQTAPPVLRCDDELAPATRSLARSAGELQACRVRARAAVSLRRQSRPHVEQRGLQLPSSPNETDDDRLATLSLKCRRAASCPSRHGRVRRCPASSHRLTAEPQRRRHVIYRCSALLRLGWRRHRATCAIGAAANASGQEPALLRTGCHRDLYHRTTTLPRTRSASACQGRMPRPLCGHYLRLQLRLDTARGWWLASA